MPKAKSKSKPTRTRKDKSFYVFRRPYTGEIRVYPLCVKLEYSAGYYGGTVSHVVHTRRYRYRDKGDTAVSLVTMCHVGFTALTGIEVPSDTLIRVTLKKVPVPK